MILRIIVFLILNFLGLAIGGIFTSKGVPSDWYYDLNKAPWTPPGWLFGAAWSTIMICFSIYMAQLWSRKVSKKEVLLLFSLLWLLNVLWNPVFFYYHHISLGLVDLLALTIGMVYTLWRYSINVSYYTVLLFPYIAWLCVATSLNAYIVIFN